ncbi:hypothetical protein BT96DRAFT_229352 [Gymnopus androsaceus JB14]|uniref:Uncharacterized protein n=1 Tax=Gymnopus androsaceus JB14 TaxID=1447944 RepID=A0A6A4H780_9AGAR|nr:hypothetical protein BT96DRAFT_229352 [Gymnopus androsaceus JB14]
MTPSEVELLMDMATSISFYNSTYIVLCVLYGVFIPLSVMAFYLFLIKGVKGYARKIILCSMIIVVLMTTWQSIVLLGSGIVLTKFYLVQTSNEGLQEQAITGNTAGFFWFLQQNWPENIILLVSDATVAWRACAVWQSSRIIRYALIVLMIGNLITNLGSGITGDLETGQPGQNTVNSRMNFASLFLSLGVNMVATLAIGIKIWYHHALTKLLYSNPNQRFSPTVKMLLLLVESGALFCVMQVLTCIFAVLDAYTVAFTPLDIAYSIIVQFFGGITPIYPMAVIIILGLKKSPLEETFHHNDESVIVTNTIEPTASL